VDFKEYKARFTEGSQGRYDITPLFSEPVVFGELVEDLHCLFDPMSYDVIAALDSLGFVLGTALARRTGKSLILIRKGGKLPFPDNRLLRKGFTDYSGSEKFLEIKPTDITHGARILIVDDWVETAAQATAAIKLIESCGGKIAGIACLGASRNERTHPLLQCGVLRPIGIED
jgi:adenine phosphoribosyltransferase